MKNFVCSSPEMELDAEERLWKQLERLGHQYIALLSDGDSNVFNLL
jgi:hypothetical protein